MSAEVEPDEQRYRLMESAIGDYVQGFPVGFVIVVKAVNSDSGEMELHSISSDGLSLWERLGMLDMATTIARNKID